MSCWACARSCCSAIELDDAYPGAHFQIAVCHYRRGAMSECAAASRRAIELNPRSAPARYRLAMALFQTQATIGRARRQRDVALEKLQRDRVLVESANRIAAMSLVAYREGAQGLPVVLEAQRNARDILSQYVNDLADVWIATATLRLYSLTPPAR